MDNTILKLDNASFGYNNELVLDNVNLDIRAGEYIGIVGLNGSGKSTLLKLILGVIKPTGGSVIKAENIKLGYVNQTTSTEEGGFPATVFELVSLGLKKKPFSHITKEEKDKVYKILDLFSIHDLANKSIQSLSGGQAQKVKISKVLLSNPDIIVLDEPTTGIDESSEAILLEMIAHLHAMKKTIIFVSHNPLNLQKCDVIYKVCDKKIKLLSEVEEDV